MIDIPTWEPVLEMEPSKKLEWVSKSDLERMIEMPPQLKPSVRKALVFIGGFMIGFIISELIMYFVVPLF